MPFDYKKYLEIAYGDWETPRKDINLTELNNYIGKRKEGVRYHYAK